MSHTDRISLQKLRDSLNVFLQHDSPEQRFLFCIHMYLVKQQWELDNIIL